MPVQESFLFSQSQRNSQDFSGRSRGQLHKTSDVTRSRIWRFSTRPIALGDSIIFPLAFFRDHQLSELVFLQKGIAK
jgi:hypothetical protein